MKSPMRVLFWTETFWPNLGGVEVLAADFLPALQQRGYEFVVVAPQNGLDRPQEDKYRGIPVYRFPFSMAMTSINELVRVREKVIRLKRDFRPQLIHINAVGPANFFHHLTTNAHSAPLLVTLHGAWSSQADSLVERTLRDADWVVGCSAAILDKGRGLAAEIASRSSVIHNGLEVPALSPTPLPFEAPRLLCLGRLHVKKGIDVALTAFESIVERFPKTRLIIAGDGPARAELEHQSISKGLNRVVDFLGWVAPKDVPNLINTCTMLLMPSRAESLPLVALQAALMARPVVGTRVGGLPEVVAHEQTGLLVESDNSAQLRDATTFLLARPDIATRMGQAARRRMQTEFSWERHVHAYDALYRKMIMAGLRSPRECNDSISRT
jgi:glycosyltransferase involved in cell wall biosynthesis